MGRLSDLQAPSVDRGEEIVRITVLQPGVAQIARRTGSSVPADNLGQGSPFEDPHEITPDVVAQNKDLPGREAWIGSGRQRRSTPSTPDLVDQWQARTSG